ncbi:ATP-binding cassette domain-containing protein [Geoalkalibacter sp.]|uniref:ATP-binding cassette domain-containing protein n=1 Tax=Geoalkalibacter sp. TaxID=3041440 RepID=UPI00272EA257|nr:ATP-binding cassette domain-containing protein [Geoalkalibacter sp.]
MLEFEGIRKTRSRDGKSRLVLDGLSLRLASHLITAVVGPSGCGKTTLIRLANRLEEPDAGRILLAGRDVRSLDPLDLRRRVGLVGQLPFMFPGTVLDNLGKTFALRRMTAPAPDSEQMLELLDLCQIPPELLGQDARRLSPGQQQRVSLARALIAGPDVLLLDEPTSALDRPTADRLSMMLRDLARSRGLTILMVTHDLRLAERCAERLAFLNEGRILEEGAAGEVLRNPRHESLRRFLREPTGLEDHS